MTWGSASRSSACKRLASAIVLHGTREHVYWLHHPQGGSARGRHYDRVETKADHYVIKPTIDRAFKPGELSTISDHKDNIHWFKAESDAAYIFNVHVIGYDKTIKESSGRLYLDVEGEKLLRGGLVKGAEDDHADRYRKHG